MKPLGVMSVGAILLGVVLLASRKPEGVVKTYVPPPASILICGLKDHPCVAYTISYHEPTIA